MNKINKRGEIKKICEKMLTDKIFRITVAKESFFWFFHFYLGHYVTEQTADFHKQMFQIAEDKLIRLAVIAAFRDSGKSTILTVAYPLWAIFSKQQKKFIVITSQTQRQVKIHFQNIKSELENNVLLKQDLGPFEEQSGESSGFSLVIPKYNARISAVSSEQTIRGIRHNQYRPDLIICDDIEDLQSVKTREGRNKTYEWLKSDVFPAASHDSKILLIGNLLHEDSVIKRLKKEIEEKILDGIYREFPLLDNDNNSLWPGKYPDAESIEKQKIKIGNEIIWQREFLLKIISSSEQVVHPEWIQYYDELPEYYGGHYRYSATGIDLAISLNDCADYTAMVTGKVYGYDAKMTIYILPNPINERLTFPETVEKVKIIANLYTRHWGDKCKIFVEEIGYQTSLIQELKRQGVDAEGARVHGQDKAARLRLTTSLIKEGRILFPKQGCEELIEQLIGFGKESHDDLADAFSILILKAIEKNRGGGSILTGKVDLL